MKSRTAFGMGALLLLATATAQAQVGLRFDPPATHLAVGATGRLGVYVDQALEIRTIDVTVDYDTTVVRSLGGEAGALYVQSGVFTFDGFDEDVPGRWHGYAVLMGAGLYIQGPGELYTWEFSARADGICPVLGVSVYLSTTDGSWFEGVTLDDGLITVGDATGSEPPAALRPGDLRLVPNPFNPATQIRFDLPDDGPVCLDVFDLRGRHVARLLEGFGAAGPVRIGWNGVDAAGRPVPGGLYLFRLETPAGILCAKGLLLE